VWQGTTAPRSTNARFAHHTIVPFGEKEIQSFVEKWYAAREREPEQAKTRAATLFNDLKTNDRLLKLAENPLTLTIIALVHQRAQGKLPDVRVELYDRCTETLIEEWTSGKDSRPKTANDRTTNCGGDCWSAPRTGCTLNRKRRMSRKYLNARWR